MNSNNGENELVEFILRPENFDTALEISEKFPQVVSRLQSKFWNTLKQRLEALMAQSSKEFKQWECELGEGDPQANYFSISLVPKTAPSAELYCFPCLQQEGPAAYLFYGVAWSKQPAQEPRIPEWDALKRRVRDDLKLANRQGGSWIGGAYQSHAIRKAETLRQLARDDSLERIQADQLVQLFKDSQELLENLNRALLKK